MSRTVVFLIIFAAICLQMLVSVFQAKDYRRALQGFSGKGIIGVGHTKGIIHPGQIILLLYDRQTQKTKACVIMRGLTVFARFKEHPEYVGLTLDEIREIGIQEDAKAFKRRRKKHPYDPDEVTKKKHALIQAVEAIDRRLANESNNSGGAETNKITVKRKETQQLADKVDPRAFNL